MHGNCLTMAGVPRDDAVLLFDAVETLLRQRLYHSAEIVGGILLSRASIPSQQSQRGGGLHAEALSMFADALKGKGEHKRAMVRFLVGVKSGSHGCWTRHSLCSTTTVPAVGRKPNRQSAFVHYICNRTYTHESCLTLEYPCNNSGKSIYHVCFLTVPECTKMQSGHRTYRTQLAAVDTTQYIGAAS